jgi:hypothetical protein
LTLSLDKLMKTTPQNFSRSPELIRACVILMTERIAILSAAALLLGLWPSEVSAGDRSFPQEITGTIRSFDEPTQTFTVEVDESARVLTIAVGRDCKFTKNGAPTGEEILKQGARVKVSCFATIFTGKIAVDVAINRVPEISGGIFAARARRSQSLAHLQSSALQLRGQLGSPIATKQERQFRR